MKAYVGPGKSSGSANIIDNSKPATAREGPGTGEDFLEVFFLPRTRDESELFYQLSNSAGRAVA